MPETADTTALGINSALQTHDNSMIQPDALGLNLGLASLSGRNCGECTSV